MIDEMRKVASPAVFDDSRLHRFFLWREWSGGNGEFCQFIGLNPSTADETVDDPTVRRCVNYAKFWGYSALCMTNIFSFRATDPKKMFAAPFPNLAENDASIALAASKAAIVIAAWGTNGKAWGRGHDVLGIVLKERKELHALRVTKNGYPAHPLYLPSRLSPILYHWRTV